MSDEDQLTAKGKLWDVKEVTHAKDFPAAVAKWESDRRVLMGAAGWGLSPNDQQFALLKMAPREVRREVLREYHPAKYPDFITLKQRIMEIFNREIQETRKPINQVQPGVELGEYDDLGWCAYPQITG